jgi:hypothetical protein
MWFSNATWSFIIIWQTVCLVSYLEVLWFNHHYNCYDNLEELYPGENVLMDDIHNQSFCCCFIVPLFTSFQTLGDIQCAWYNLTEIPFLTFRSTRNTNHLHTVLNKWNISWPIFIAGAQNWSTHHQMTMMKATDKNSNFAGKKWYQSSGSTSVLCNSVFKWTV